MRLLRFHVTTEYVPGHDMANPGMLSRNPLKGQEALDNEENIDAYVDGIIKDKLIISEKIRQIQVASAQDEGILLAMNFCLYGWPESYRDISESACEFFSVRSEMSVSKRMLICHSRIMMPERLRHATLLKIHKEHQGIYTSAKSMQEDRVVTGNRTGHGQHDCHVYFLPEK